MYSKISKLFKDLTQEAETYPQISKSGESSKDINFKIKLILNKILDILVQNPLFLEYSF